MVKQFPTLSSHSLGHVPEYRADPLSKDASTTALVFFRNTFLFKFVQKDNTLQKGKRMKILLLDTAHSNWQHLLCRMDFTFMTIMEIMVHNTHLKNHIHLDLI